MGLPDTYRAVVAWLANGWSEDDIAVALDVDIAAVRPLIRIAHAKLARLSEGS